MDIYLSDNEVKFPRFLLVDKEGNELFKLPSEKYIEPYVRMLKEQGYDSIYIIEKFHHASLGRLMKDKKFENTDKAKEFYEKNKYKIDENVHEKNLNKYKLKVDKDGNIKNLKKYYKDKEKINKISKMFK